MEARTSKGDDDGNPLGTLGRSETEAEIQQERRELPIFEFKDDIVKLIRSNLFCIITGETGSGKST